MKTKQTIKIFTTLTMMGISLSACSSDVGCNGRVASLFDSAKGTYQASARTSDGKILSFSNDPAMVLGFSESTSYEVTVNQNCTVSVGNLTLSYEDGSYNDEYKDTGVTIVGLTGTGVSRGRLDFQNGKRQLFMEEATTEHHVSFDE